MVFLPWARRADRKAPGWTAVAFVCGLALLAAGCGGRVGRVGRARPAGDGGHSSAEGGRGAGGAPGTTADDDDDDGAAQPGTAGTGGNSAASGGSTGQAGSDEPSRPAAASTGFAMVAGGTLMRSKSYTLVLCAGESPGSNGLLHSSGSKSYRMVGGLVGVTAR
jgi:hypothetical protein